MISNLIVDQTANNPAAYATATTRARTAIWTSATVGNDDVSRMASDRQEPGPGRHVRHRRRQATSFYFPNVTPDAGLSAPFNAWFTFFGQFFDHGLDLVTKGGNGTIFVPLKPDDPLVAGADGISERRRPPRTTFMVETRATDLPGPDGVLGTADDIHENENTTTPFVDQNQTYTSHPSHQVFLRAYKLDADGASGRHRQADHQSRPGRRRQVRHRRRSSKSAAWRPGRWSRRRRATSSASI